MLSSRPAIRLLLLHLVAAGLAGLALRPVLGLAGPGAPAVPGLPHQPRPGAVVATYQKHNQAPPEQGLAVRQAYEVQQVSGAAYGLAICKDMHFAALVRAYGQRQVAAMLVPVWGFDTDRHLAAEMTATRGVENGYVVIRAARSGLLTVSDAYDHLLGEQASAPLPGSTLLVRAPVGPPLATANTRLGNWLGWLCVVAGAGLLALGRRRTQENFTTLYL